MDNKTLSAVVQTVLAALVVGLGSAVWTQGQRVAEIDQVIVHIREDQARNERQAQDDRAAAKEERREILASLRAMQERMHAQDIRAAREDGFAALTRSNAARHNQRDVQMRNVSESLSWLRMAVGMLLERSEIEMPPPPPSGVYETAD